MLVVMCVNVVQACVRKYPFIERCFHSYIATDIM